MDSTCQDGICGKCHAAKFIAVGVILIANRLWWNFDWFYLIGFLLVAKGVLKLTMPNCSHCMPAEQKKGRK